MPADLSDSSIAETLKSDARASALRYSTVGLEAFLPERSRGGPKPNTQFLNNILKDAKSHNDALKRREEREARARRRDGDARNSRAAKRSGRSHREHDAYSDEDRHRRKRRRRDDSEDRRKRGSRSERERDGKEEPRRRHDRSRSPDRHRDRKQPHRERGDRGVGRDGHPSRRRERSRDQGDERSSRHRHSERRRRSESRDSGEGDRVRRKCKTERHEKAKENSSTKRLSEPSKAPESSSEEDPLNEFYGPRIAAPVRGRGPSALKTGGKSAMDAHFDEDYDPARDIRPDNSDDTDVDPNQELEAARYRAYWRKEGAQRLREAGLKESEIARWATGRERDESDVTWNKHGESREWDKGKSIEGDEIKFKPAWA